jgi:hypothetical protein
LFEKFLKPTMCKGEHVSRSEEAKKRFAADAQLLAKIGSELGSQNFRITVRISKDLAVAAQAAWERDEDDLVGPETAEEQGARWRAGTLALIGMAVDEVGDFQGDDVVVSLSARDISSALDALEELGPGEDPQSIDAVIHQ